MVVCERQGKLMSKTRREFLQASVAAAVGVAGAAGLGACEPTHRDEAPMNGAPASAAAAAVQVPKMKFGSAEIGRL
ncbi:MAG: twin-arginine translocation signal domain-containing protein, partial [Terracidiphilus sp.]|nr:twin-arginine translocation signal domain-containing protein [Terracidiphilus sp.]